MKRNFWIYTLIGVFVFVLAGCTYAPKQSWTPKYKSYIVTKKKR